MFLKKLFNASYTGSFDSSKTYWKFFSLEQNVAVDVRTLTVSLFKQKNITTEKNLFQKFSNSSEKKISKTRLLNVFFKVSNCNKGHRKAIGPENTKGENDKKWKIMWLNNKSANYMLLRSRGMHINQQNFVQFRDCSPPIFDSEYLNQYISSVNWVNPSSNDWQRMHSPHFYSVFIFTEEP